MDLGSLTVVLPLAGEALALHALGNLADALRGLREHGLHGDAQRDVASLCQVGPIAALHERANDLVKVRHLTVSLFHSRLHGDHTRLHLAQGGAAAEVGDGLSAAPLGGGQGEGGGESLEQGGDLDAHPQLRLQHAHDVLGLLPARCNEHLLHLVLFRGLRVPSLLVRNGPQLGEEFLDGQLRREHEDLLRVPTQHGDLAEVLGVARRHAVVDVLRALAEGLAHGLDHKTVADAELRLLVVRRHLVAQDVDRGDQVLWPRVQNRAEHVGQKNGHLLSRALAAALQSLDLGQHLRYQLEANGLVYRVLVQDQGRVEGRRRQRFRVRAGSSNPQRHGPRVGQTGGVRSRCKGLAR
mmetsp:Transcript_40922/g.131608  ORF Transcript_40922/g.131608 Transcript_40922/m.131608 type:complete len:353 (-) Transcript_40922:133-1191(-)